VPYENYPHNGHYSACGLAFSAVLASYLANSPRTLDGSNWIYNFCVWVSWCEHTEHFKFKIELTSLLVFFDLETSLSPSLPYGSTISTTIFQNGIEAFVLPA
jgi:hypothetical protein